MQRRVLLRIMMAAVLGSCGIKEQSAKGLKITVVGAGIVGASIAWHLARAGALVTIIDAIGPASHASRGTFAWINASWAKQPRHYHALSQEGVSGWGSLQEELSLPIRWGGSLEWFSNPERDRKLLDQIAEQVDWGESARMVNADELAVMEPNVNFHGALLAAFSGNDGAIDPVRATNALLDAAVNMGAVLRTPCKLLDISLSGNRLHSVETSLGTIPADRVVLATGADPATPKIIAGVDVPQRSTPGIIAITAPMPKLLNRIIVASGIHLHQREDGRIVMGEQDGAPDDQAHDMRLEGRPNTFPSPDMAVQHAARMLSIATKYVPGMAGVNVDDVFIGWRPLPLDGHPVLGFSPERRDVYLAIMHSGVTLAPIAGQLTAHEVINDIVVERLEAFRPGRDFETVKRY